MVTFQYRKQMNDPRIIGSGSCFGKSVHITVPLPDGQMLTIIQIVTLQKVDM